MSDQRTAKHYGPSDKATLPAKMSTKLVGCSFSPGYPGVLHTLAAVVEGGQTPLLKLVRDANNPYDSNAVAVRSAHKGTHLGHLPAALAARIAPEMDTGTFWLIESYEVLVHSHYDDRPGLSLNLRRMSGSAPDNSSERGRSLSGPARTVKYA